MDIAIIGFGEAAQAFVEGWAQNRPSLLRVFDIKTLNAPTSAAKRSDYERHSVHGAATLAEALQGASLVLSLVTADQSLAVALAAAQRLEAGAMYMDMNSVAPQTKRLAADAIEAGGGRYVDVALMAPVHPLLNRVPLLVSGAHVDEAIANLEALKFSARSVSGSVGAASAIKMIRSVMIKGLEALTAECLLSARAAGVQDEVIESLDASFPGFDWRARADYNLDRMLVHGLRRAAEMREVAETTRALGQTGAMADATVAWQQRLGSLSLPDLPVGFEAKADAILQNTQRTLP